MNTNNNLILIATLVGFFGDVLTQQLVYNESISGVDGWGLKSYFKQHGKIESLILGSGVMAFFYSLYALTGLPFKVQWLAIYGIILDFIFRYTRFFPSLDEYYSKVGIIGTSIVGGLFPLILPLFVYKIINPSVSIF